MSERMNITLPNDTLEGTTATLSAWLVQEGESVKKGAPILEIETDKVSMEVCAERDGVVAKILAVSGDSVGEETVFGYLEDGIKQVHSGQSSLEQNSQERKNKPAESLNMQDDRRHLIGPAVRKLLRQHDLKIEQIIGTGMGGRVTRTDVLEWINSQHELKFNPLSSTSSSLSKTQSNNTIIPHTPMRKTIASHMVNSLLHTSPHVTSVFEMDMSRLIEHRNMCKMGFLEAGVKLTFTAYFIAASVQAIRKVPSVNARFYEEYLEVFKDINIGVGTALGDDGLVVPVVKQAQDKNLFEIASALQQQTERARNGKLTMADMKEGTFTISNHGVGGSLLATPIIINQPQVAILGIGKLEKRAVVEEVNGEDVIKIRPKCYVSLSIDHRALDAHQTNLFLSHFVETIETWGK